MNLLQQNTICLILTVGDRGKLGNLVESYENVNRYIISNMLAFRYLEYLRNTSRVCDGSHYYDGVSEKIVLLEQTSNTM